MKTHETIQKRDDLQDKISQLLKDFKEETGAEISDAEIIIQRELRNDKYVITNYKTKLTIKL